MHLLNVLALSHHLLCLHKHDVSVVAGDDGCLQLVLALVGLSFQNVHGQLEELIAAGGVDVGGFEVAAKDVLDAAVGGGKGIDAAETSGCRQLPIGLQLLSGAKCHAVVLSEDVVDLRVAVGLL